MRIRGSPGRAVLCLIFLSHQSLPNAEAARQKTLSSERRNEALRRLRKAYGDLSSSPQTDEQRQKQERTVQQQQAPCALGSPNGTCAAADPPQAAARVLTSQERESVQRRTAVVAHSIAETPVLPDHVRYERIIAEEPDLFADVPFDSFVEFVDMFLKPSGARKRIPPAPPPTGNAGTEPLPLQPSLDAEMVLPVANAAAALPERANNGRATAAAASSGSTSSSGGRQPSKPSSTAAKTVKNTLEEQRSGDEKADARAASEDRSGAMNVKITDDTRPPSQIVRQQQKQQAPAMEDAERSRKNLLEQRAAAEAVKEAAPAPKKQQSDLAGGSAAAALLRAGYDDDLMRRGLLKRPVTAEMRAESDRLGRERAGRVKAAMERVWDAYRTHAWGHDEVKPKSRRSNNNWGGMGVTLVDSLDTLWLMGLTDQFWEARDWVRDHLTFEKAGTVSVFETTIRVLGGLLSAHDLSGDAAFLAKAKELGDLLLPAFGSGSGMPYKMLNLKTGRPNDRSQNCLAEVGTVQLEFRQLSRATNDTRYAERANRVFDLLAGQYPPFGLYPIRINPETGKSVGSQVTFGALGDSFYEYLLKVWLQGRRHEKNYREMYDRAMDGVHSVLLAEAAGLTYLSEWNGKTLQHRMDHLACFVAGNLALGAMTSPESPNAARDLQTGKALAYTCHEFYSRTATKLPPETVEFTHNAMRPKERAKYYVLRPEAVESFYILHEITGDPMYREWGWNVFTAIEEHCRVGAAYGSHPDVTDVSREPEDHMESFFPGETLKYLWLLLMPNQPIGLQTHVFNTEAHPMRIFPETLRERSPLSGKDARTEAS